jgi:hypothetical protein
MIPHLAACVLALSVAGAVVSDAVANPARIIILRHGEKADGYRLCSVGVQRSLALAKRYLGKGAEATLFPGGAPDAFFAITLHTLELVSPAATSWRKPVVMYSALPVQGQSAADKVRTLNERTQEAAAEVMSNWRGKTIVMVWEHDHIADQKLEATFPDQKVTLRQLLNLEALDNAPDGTATKAVPKTVPATWPGDNYDYFWIVDYAGSSRPTRFEMVRQAFTSPFQEVPSNEWGAPYPLPKGCRN